MLFTLLCLFLFYFFSGKRDHACRCHGATARRDSAAAAARALTPLEPPRQWADLGLCRQDLSRLPYIVVGPALPTTTAPLRLFRRLPPRLLLHVGSASPIPTSIPLASATHGLSGVTAAGVWGTLGFKIGGVSMGGGGDLWAKRLCHGGSTGTTSVDSVGVEVWVVLLFEFLFLYGA